MKLTGKLISKVLVLCGISLTCTACYAAPMSDYMLDIEGPDNGGEFAAEVVEVKAVSDDYVGGDGWDSGKATQERDFEPELKPEEDENE
jgi:hypothetical protein